MNQQQVNWNQSLQHAAVTDIGMRRSNNQDSYSVVLAGDLQQWYSRGHLFLVADGMGAHAAGELASKLAVDGIPHLYHKLHDKSPPEALQKAIQDTNIEVHRRGEANLDFQHMGTTSSLLAMLPQGALIAHIGDSRIYRLRGDKLRQLTFDHSLVWEMQASGKMPEGVEAGEVVPKNVITRSLGPNARVKIDFEGPFPVAVGDTFLLCSDGLTGRVEDEELAAFLAHMSPQEAAHALIDLANVRGGPDNTTIIIVKVVDPAITTAAVQAEPLVLGAAMRDHRDVHPAVWVAAGVCVLAAAVMAIIPIPIAALILACVGILAGLVGILQKFGSLQFGGKKEVPLTQGKRLGAGPYTETAVPTGQKLAQIIQDAITRTTNTSQRRNHEMDFDRVGREAGAAIDAAKTGESAQALKQFSETVHYMIEEIRRQQKAAASDSNVI